MTPRRPMITEQIVAKKPIKCMNISFLCQYLFQAHSFFSKLECFDFDFYYDVCHCQWLWLQDYVDYDT